MTTPSCNESYEDLAIKSLTSKAASNKYSYIILTDIPLSCNFPQIFLGTSQQLRDKTTYKKSFWNVPKDLLPTFKSIRPRFVRLTAYLPAGRVAKPGTAQINLALTPAGWSFWLYK